MTCVIDLFSLKGYYQVQLRIQLDRNGHQESASLSQQDRNRFGEKKDSDQ